MRVLFISPNTERMNMPTLPLGLAVEEGVISAEDDLLVPRFYIRPGLEDYIREVQEDV